MKVPVLSIIVLLSLLAVQSAQGAALGDSQRGTTTANYAERSENSDTQFLNVDRWRSAFQSKEFLNWHALYEVSALPPCLLSRRGGNRRCWFSKSSHVLGWAIRKIPFLYTFNKPSWQILSNKLPYKATAKWRGEGKGG
uniref:Keratinocyte differentiation-associated protein isoform X1 n=1 Tax=Phascolarctos cinereus TaxID=38626 RepID=A0A6P5JR44_PHACI|nr:keratinocyte differentiation-associated protein isoform X1 [Phascolarctos cinereus]